MPDKELTELQRAMIEHDEDASRLDRNTLSTTPADIPILDDDGISAIEAEQWVYSYGDDRENIPVSERRVPIKVSERDALCQTVRVLRAENSDLRRSVEEWVTRYNDLEAWRVQTSAQLAKVQRRLMKAFEGRTGHQDGILELEIPGSPVCGDIKCPLHGDRPDTSSTSPTCSQNFMPPAPIQEQLK